MNAFHLQEEGRLYWLCGGCLADHKKANEAERCCKGLAETPPKPSPGAVFGKDFERSF